MCVNEENPYGVQAKLGDLVSRIVGGGTPARMMPKYWGGDIPWASVKDFNDQCYFLEKTQEKITEQGLAASSANLIPSGVPILCSRMAVGRCVLTKRATAINQDLKALFPEKGVDPGYLLWLLKHVAPALQQQGTGSTVSGVTISQVISLPLYKVYGIETQRSIAAILDSVDEAIRQTEAVIAKLRVVKAGMLHDLLTYGLDDNGELRDPVRHPDQFKDSPLGRIPNEWEIEFLGNHILLLSGQHIEAKCYSENSKHAPYLTGPADFPEGKIIVTKYTAFPKVVCRLGDILITVKGSGTGKTIVADASYCISRQLMAVRAKTCSPRFLHYLLTSFSESLRADASGLIPGISRMDLLDKKISCPPKSEQQDIADKLDSFDQSEEKEKQQLYKLLKFKHGLMHDLLTGTVRVPANLLEATS